MTEQEKELLLKDLKPRIGYGLKVQVCGNTEYAPTLEGMLHDEMFVQFDYLKPVTQKASTYNVERDNVKPYLRPMSSMTEEEKAELYDMCDVAYSFGMKIYDKTPEFYDWLDAHHFDYRGLIEKWLAIEAPEGMYN